MTHCGIKVKSFPQRGTNRAVTAIPGRETPAACRAPGRSDKLTRGPLQRGGLPRRQPEPAAQSHTERQKEKVMGNTFKMVTIVGISPTSYEEAIASALADASATLRGLAWFEVVEMRGRIDGNQVAEFQVKLQVGFKVEAS